jgi:hypothetical protein
MRKRVWIKIVLAMAVVLGGGLFFRCPVVAGDSKGSSRARVYCLKGDAPYGLHGPIYVDRNGDGKIDWEVDGPRMMAEGISCFKIDTNFDGYYDVKSWTSIPITGEVKTWGTNIHERVPEIGKDFVRITAPNWVSWPEPPGGRGSIKN